MVTPEEARNIADEGLDSLRAIFALRDLAAQVEALQAHASRYRWLRMQCNLVTNLVQYPTEDGRRIVTCNSAKEMDAAIDAAREQS